MMSLLFYNTLTRFYFLAIHLAAPFNQKARLWVAGRRGRGKLKSSSDKGCIWFHCASLGEFEQGRPLIEATRKQHPDKRIVLTFFSPSGYEVRKNYPLADEVRYLPADTRVNARAFIRYLNPEKAYFIKYEFWYHHLNELIRENIPVYIVSGIFRKDQHFFKWYGGMFRKLFQKITHFFVQDESSEKLLRSIGITRVSVSGDTRFDRVYSIARQAADIPVANAFSKGKSVWVAGSTWPADEKILSEMLRSFSGSGLRLLIAPHELTEEHLHAIESLFSFRKVIRFSGTNEQEAAIADVLIADNMGMLSSLYRYGKFAYVGGGFGKGIHNVLEAAVYGVPVFFGPHYQKFREATELIRAGGGFSIKSAPQMITLMEYFTASAGDYQKAAQASRDFVKNNLGATEKVLGL